MMKYLDLPVWLVFGYFDVKFSMIFVKFLRNYDQSYDQDDQIYEQNASPAQRDKNCPHFDSSEKLKKFFLLADLVRVDS